MGLKIKKDETLSAGIKRALQEECNNALHLLTNGDLTHQKVHEVRKSYKKIRAVHRLIRDCSNFYKEENNFFRDEGRKFSKLRDATSVIEILEALKEKYDDVLYKNTFEKVHQSLITDRENKMKSFLSENKDFTNLKEKCSEYHNLSLSLEEFSPIKTSLKRVYRRGFKAFHKALKTPDKDTFHDWRKRAKYLRYHIKMLKETWKPIYNSWENELHKLTDFLGDDQDTYHLRNRIEAGNVEFNNEEKSLLLALIEQNQKEYKKSALQLGRKLYALSPSEFIHLMYSSWKTSDLKI